MSGTRPGSRRPSGGGFENPLERDPEAVRADVLDEYVSMAAARDRYGVVVTGSPETCDVALDVSATQSLRARLQAERTSEPEAGGRQRR